MRIYDSATPRRVAVLAGVKRGSRITFMFDGEPIVAFEGETVAAALIGAGKTKLRSTQVASAPRGLFCGIGVCFGCLVVIDGEPSRRACVTFAHDGMEVRTQSGNGEVK
jgi:predicted molibdopterin-dependent oxidoreductase YjgC